MPVEVVGARLPLPGVGTGCPGNVDAVQLVVTLIRVPCTLPIRKGIATAPWRLRSASRIAAPTSARMEDILAWNTDGLGNINNVGIGDVVVGGKMLPAGMIASSYAAKGITTSHAIRRVSTGAG